ncbi:AMP-binding enzyme domain-containing protein [Hirsutella rhossiliensis]|uniref:AMP-binding enzyme domain-containing protein n=1 Tax=Hirsutella rhossiliensis TaxID=111463 RepID=A0A9P8MS10_9HYPO|nr:AMP-binding enzyme domain-containing protein [Hirsutella rhossiliensis]KAH0959414.1 AMP-binding enzyme domain-containing protein [Hirsutella rhossiliensis]
MNTPVQAREPIAIVGIACRFPGGANSPSKLWDLLCEKRDVQETIPVERFNIDAFYDVNSEKAGCTNARKAYLLSEDIRRFDAAFFQTSPPEAEAMDPQQRLLLETVYEATEDAGLPYQSLKGSNTAVYVGSMTGDYHEMLLRDVQHLPKYMATGTARSILSNRISYFFDWKGPSMTIDTACSSSLVAVHEAVTALRSGVSDVACAAGANLIIGPEMMVSESKLHMLSPTGRSRMWDASADGYARGEGTATVVLKRLSQALKDGDRIHGLIRETGVNSDGRTSGITLPSSESQKVLIRQTYANAGLDWTTDAGRPQFFEAHGTGTPAGDPIEARAIHDAFFGNGTSNAEGTMLVGSVKTAIGHLEGCAGLAGLIKAVEAVRRGVVPPNMLFKKLNPAIEPFSAHLRVPIEAAPWPELSRNTPRRASVNSFGFGGTNAHAIVESFPGYPTAAEPTRSCSDSLIVTPLVVSANSEHSLQRLVAGLCESLGSTNNEEQVNGLLFTLAKRRSQLPLRVAFSGSSLQAMREKLDKATTSADEAPGRILGVFTGQGAQWPTMGRELLRRTTFARGFMDSLQEALANLPEPPSWTLSEQCLADQDVTRISEAAVSQPLCTAVQLLLVELLRRAGVRFDCVIGHSSGEIAAAYVAGFLTAEDAIRIAYYRGVCAGLARGPGGHRGAMMAAGMSYDEAVAFCGDHFAGRIDVAAANAPGSVTLSGDEDAVGEAMALLQEKGTFARLLKVDTAYHSRHMQPCGGDPSCEWFSSVTGQRMDAAQHSRLLEGEYWKENMVKPVFFTRATELVVSSAALPCHVALEVGPHPALKGPFGQTFKQVTGAQIPYQGTLARGVDDVEAMSDTLGFLWSRLGSDAVDFASYAETISSATFCRLPATNLPSYPWDHSQSFWKESTRSAALRLRSKPPHPLLGVRSAEDAAQEYRWLNTLRLPDLPWLEGHKVEGQVIYPAAGYLVMAMEAAKALDETSKVHFIELYDVSISSAIQLDYDSSGVDVLFALRLREQQTESTTAEWACYTSSPATVRETGWKCNANGRLRVKFGPPASANDTALPPRNLPVGSLSTVDMDRFYTSLSGIGLDYTGDFKHLDSVSRKSGLATAKAAQMAPRFSAMIHPALLDSAFQSLFAAYGWPGDGSLQVPFVPTSLRSLRLANMEDHVSDGESLTIDAYLTDCSGRELTADIEMFVSASGQPLMQLQGLACTSLRRLGPQDCKELYTRTAWELDINNGVASLDMKQQQDDPEDVELVDLCERLSYFYLRELHGKIDRKEVPAMEWHFQRIFEWIDHLFPMIEAGKHPTIRKEWSMDQRSSLLEQAARFPDQVDLLLIQAVGENLGAVLRKETTMLEHMIKDDVLNRFYKFGLGFQRANGYLSRIAKQIAHMHPRMRILEIGAGTGGATKGILETLGTAFESYTFTDISTGFFEAAAEAFAPWTAKMLFKPLNVEKDPAAQGFTEASYDFIIASNVLHATKSLTQTMRNARRLLKPGGRLLLLEVTSDIWNSLLLSTGFSGVDHTVNDFVDATRYMTSVMLTQAVNDDIRVLRQPLSSPIDWLSGRAVTIIGGKNNRVAKSISDTLLAVNGSPSNAFISFVGAFEKMPSELPTMRTVLVLEDLDEPVLKTLTPGKLAALKRTMNEARQVLWVSRGCREKEPYANMSIGLCRSLAAEYNHVQIQHIDVEESGPGNPLMISRISEAVARLIFRTTLKGPMDDILWSFEPELVLEQGSWFIPRILPDTQLNDQLNAGKMAIQTRSSPATEAVEVRRARNGSRVFAPRNCVFDCLGAARFTRLSEIALTMVASQLLEGIASTIVLHQEDEFLGKAIRCKAAELGIKCVSTAFACSTRSSKGGRETIFMHPQAPERDVKHLIPHDAALLVDFSNNSKTRESTLLRLCMPARCLIAAVRDLFGGDSDELHSTGTPGPVFLATESPVIRTSELSGKPLLDTHYSSVVDFATEAEMTATLQPLNGSLLFRPDKAYLLVGCTGGLGQALCRWMVSAGVRYLALTTRNTSRVDASWLEELRLQGAHVKLFQVDVSDKEALAAVYDQVTREMPPICGVAHAAMVLSDRSFGESTIVDYATVFGPKVQATQNLHELFHDQQLDFFVMFSSLASIVGNRGQANYAAANLFMSAIAQQRRTRKMAASVMHIGMVLGVGYVSSNGAHEETLRQYNYMPIAEGDFLDMFSQAILIGQPTSRHSPELITGLNRCSLQTDGQRYFWFENPRFSHHTLEEERKESATGSKTSLSQRLAEANGSEEVLVVVQEEFCAKLERMLQAECGSVRTSQPLMNLGVDSLIAAEIRSWFLKELDVDIPVLNILNTASVAELCREAASRLSKALQARGGDAVEAPVKLTPAEREIIMESSDGSVTDEATSEPSQIGSSLLESVDDTSGCTSVEDDEKIPSLIGKRPRIERSSRLSSAQERIWFLHQLLQDPSTYNVTLLYRISGPLRLTDLEKAFHAIIRRHETLRTCFYTDQDTGLPTQGVCSHGQFSLQKKQYTTSSAQEEFEQIQKAHYDLETGPIIKAIVGSNPGNDHHTLVLGFHHIAFDGFSAQILMRDLAIAYSGTELSGTPRSYLDYAEEERDAKISVKTLRYWKTQFDTMPPILPLLEFAECKARVPLTDYKTRALERTLPSAVSDDIKSAARKMGATPFHVYLGALQAVLFNLTSATDVCIGVVDANKTEAGYTETIGFFVNLLPLRFQLNASKTLGDMVGEAKVKANEALAHRMPFDGLLDELKVPRSTTHSPLFQAILNVKMGSTKNATLGDCQAELVGFKDADNPYDLVFDIESYQDGSTSISVKTQRYLYTEHELGLVLETYIRTLSLLAERPSQKVTASVAPTAEERAMALQLGRGMRIPSPKFGAISHYFDHWASKQPGAMAVKDDSGVNLSYTELKSRVNDVAATLKQAGLRPGAKVCVYCEPSVRIICCLLATVKVGGAYVPLDMQNPTRRLQLIVDDCEPDMILFDEATSSVIPQLQTSARLLNVDNIKPTSGPSTYVEDVAQSSETAFIFYTSGTTGVPKGVQVTNRSLVHHSDAVVHFYGIQRGVVLQQAPLGFDLSLSQMALSMMTGGTLLVASSATRRDPEQLAWLMLSGRVTHTIMTPTQALALIRHGHDDLSKCVDWRFSLLSGEPFRAHVVSEFRRLDLAGLGLYNGYGPTEITINSSSGPDELIATAPKDTRDPTIGHTLPNYSCYILNEQLQPVRVGFAGELFVGGAGVAAGYLRHRALTELKFIADPFAQPEDVARGWSRMYRTGDKAKLLPDGRIVFLGRIAGDTQVKLRGFRIELDDIASNIVKSSNGMISEAAVSLRHSADGSEDGAFLVAFAALSGPGCPQEGTARFLKQLLRDLSLPQYMMPSRIVPVDGLPINSSGKLDRHALDVLPVPHDPDTVEDESLTATQEKLRELWLNVLPSVVPIGSETDFFEAGGNSLRIVVLRESVARAFGAPITVFDLFQWSTLAGMAARIDSSSESPEQRNQIDWAVETRVEAATSCPEVTSKGGEARSAFEITEVLEVVLTGATGFLGSAILQMLLDDKAVSRIHCIALRNSARALEQHPLLLSARVTCYEGDLSQPQLGLSRKDYDALSQKAHRIIHNGADVSFLKSYHSLRKPNVGSTQELAMLAAPRRVPFHFVSSGGIVNLTGLDGLPEISVSGSHPPTDGSQGYAASKWASEVYLEECARHLGIPIWIHRPSNITGGNVPSTDLMGNLIKYSGQVHALPDMGLSWRGSFDFVPVEAVAEGIAGSLHEPGATGRIVYRHHCADEKIPVHGLAAHLEAELGAPLEMVSVDEWLSRAEGAGLDGTASLLIRKMLDGKKGGGGIVPCLLKE